MYHTSEGVKDQQTGNEMKLCVTKFSNAKKK